MYWFSHQGKSYVLMRKNLNLDIYNIFINYLIYFKSYYYILLNKLNSLIQSSYTRFLKNPGNICKDYYM